MTYGPGTPGEATSPPFRRRGGPAPVAFALALALAPSLPLSVHAQEAPPDGSEPTPAPQGEPARDAAAPESGWWKGPWGVAEPDRLFAGLWTLHLYRREDGLSAHHLLGLNWRGMMGTTFVNSHGARSWGFGIARNVVQVEGRDLGVSFGYRAGVIRGYDEKLHDLAGRWPVIPAAELVGGVRYGRVGAHVSWAGIVSSVGGFVELRGR